ncbi:MAG: UbiD family decarboxylase, partial [Alphaproteobacteria bacterium]|nr:UbiD family decarboxylase [Alphaproteobacteria bacterium]
MNKDLRTFIAEVRQMGPDYFRTVSRTVDPIFEPCVIQQKLAAEKRYPVLRFDDIKGSDMSLVTNFFGSYGLLGLALGVGPDEPKRQILERFRMLVENPLPVVEVEAKDAPVKDIVLTGDDIDLGRLPIVRHAELNPDKYITVGCLIVRDPETGVLNAGMYRHQLKGKNQVAGMFNPSHHAGYIYRRYKELGKPMEGVLFIGHHPAAVMGALARGPIESNEL